MRVHSHTCGGEDVDELLDAAGDVTVEEEGAELDGAAAAGSFFSPAGSLDPSTCPPRIPPPATATLKAYGQ